jgi:hypothetical protein
MAQVDGNRRIPPGIIQIPEDAILQADLKTGRAVLRDLPAAMGTDVDPRTPVAHLLAIRKTVEEFGNG